MASWSECGCKLGGKKQWVSASVFGCTAKIRVGQMCQKNESCGSVYPQGAELASEAELKICCIITKMRGGQTTRQRDKKILTWRISKAASPITIGRLEELRP